jgi:TRAP-type C4-dicarboxylate transport system substrate-binding protein
MMRVHSFVFAMALVLGALPALGGTTFKIATVVPDGSSWMQEMRKAAAEIQEASQGRVKLKFYPGGVMGNDQTVLRKMRAGQLHGGAFPSGALARLYPDIDLYSLPLVFRSYEEVDFVRSKLDATLAEGLEGAGVVPLAISDGGFAYLMSQRPVQRVDDLSRAKVWIQEGDVMSQTALETAGVSPVQIPLADVYTALQTGLVDTVAAPPIATIAFQWHTKVKYLTDVPLMYLVGVFVLDARAWRKLSPDDQELVRRVVSETTLRLDAANRTSETAARQALQQQGIRFVEASSAEELARWRDITERALVELRKRQIYSDPLIEAVQAHLAEFRGGGAGAGGD